MLVFNNNKSGLKFTVFIVFIGNREIYGDENHNSTANPRTYRMFITDKSAMNIGHGAGDSGCLLMKTPASHVGACLV